MATKEIVSGVGARYASVFLLDSNGLPMPADSSAVPVQGSLVQGIKSLAITDPEPQRITHYGDDFPFAQDSLPPTEIGGFTVVTAKTNLIIDAMLEGNKVVTIDNLNMRGDFSDKRGNEPLVMFAAFRQALDTKKGSSTLGKLRQWHLKIFPSTRITPQSQAFEQAATDKTYQATPTMVSTTPWAQTFDETTWGQNESKALEIICDYQPRINTYRGNGTIAAFQLSHPPVADGNVHVWSNGTAVTPTAVNTSPTNPAFTLASPPGVGNLVFAIVETLQPGNT